MQPDKELIDQVFRDKLKHYEVPPPVDAWERIRGRKGTAKRGRPVNRKWWLWVLLVGSLSIGGYYLLHTEEPQPTLFASSMSVETSKEQMTEASGVRPQPVQETRECEDKSSEMEDVSNKNTVAKDKTKPDVKPKLLNLTAAREQTEQPVAGQVSEPLPIEGNAPDEGQKEQPTVKTTSTADRYSVPPTRVRVQVILSPEREQQAIPATGAEERKPMGIRIIRNKKVQKVLNQVLYLKKEIGE
jgi:hypothetical protein